MPTITYMHTDPIAGVTCRMGPRFQVFQTSQVDMKVCDSCSKPIKVAPALPAVVDSSTKLDALQRAAFNYSNKPVETLKPPIPPSNPTGNSGPLVG